MFAIAGILATSRLTGLATALPRYLDARKQIENSVGYDIRSRAEATGQLLAHFSSVALQVTSRTQLREALERYNRSALSLPELQRFSVSRLRDALAASGLPPAWLELEITEGLMLHDVAQTTRVLEALRALGVTLAIDDFGTGYSSLSYLKRLPLNRLKIDRSFVSGLPDDRDDLSIVATILATARNLGLEVVAEAVETAAQLHYLREHGRNAYQGWLCAPAMDADALQTLLDTQAASV